MQGRYHIITYGCQMNESDSERLAGQLENLNYKAVDEPAKADIILINTCCVRESAENKVYGKIGELTHLKRKNPNLLIGIMGCMAQKNKEALFKRAPHIDFILGPYNIHHLERMVAEKNILGSHIALTNMRDADIEDFTELPAKRQSNVFAWVPIMQGCNKFCTYCIVPYVRGREWSRPLSSIYREVKELAMQGYKEITLLGQNVNAYGLDFKDGTDFSDLLLAINEISGLERIRYMTSHPRDMDFRMIDTIATCEKVCTQMHLPIQSGSDEVLKMMNRGYTLDHYLTLLDYIREKIPNVVLTTDLIVGFPGETEEMHSETAKMLQNIRFDMAYTFLFSKRSGTPAAYMKNQVDEVTKKRRLQELMAIQNEISLALNKRMENRTYEIIVEGPTKNNPSNWYGRTSGNKMILFPRENNIYVGDTIDVKVEKAQTWILRGRPTERSRNGEKINADDETIS